jgi:hypothetical protein
MNMNNKKLPIMKRNLFAYTIAMLAFALFSYSCTDNSQKTEADSKLGTLKVEIPETLKNKPEVVAYIHDMSKVADDYAILIDKTLADFGDYHNKDFEQLGMMDKIKVMKATAEIGFKSMEMMTKWGEHHDKLNLFKEDLTEDETLALESVVNRFEERMKQIKKKHSKYFSEDLED